MGTLKARADDPEQVTLIQAASSTEEFSATLKVLTEEGVQIRGCKVNPDRPHLQALQNFLDWPIGGYDTRPTPEASDLKQKDRLKVLVSYRQPPDLPPPRVAMYDYLCDTLFGIPMRPVGADVPLPEFQDGETTFKAQWVEADWEAFRLSGRPRPAPVFAANRYPYQVPEVRAPPGAGDLERRAQHWILWYCHLPGEAPLDPGDAAIDADVQKEVGAAAEAAGYACADFIWYRNPGMSVPEVFHVQVFWIARGPRMPEEERRSCCDRLRGGGAKRRYEVPPA